MAREEKWVYEIIAENIPPFKWLPPALNVWAQLFLMYGLAILLFYFFKIPPYTIIFAYVGLFVIAAWNLLMLQLAPTIRRVDCPLEGKEKEFLKRHRRLLFHPRHYEMYLGIFIFIFLAGYLLFGPGNLLAYWFGPTIHPALLFFVLVFTFDVAYRSAVAIWVSGLALWRSLWIKRYIEMRERMEYIPYTGLKNLRRIDLYNLSFVLVSLPLFPTIWSDKVVTYGLALLDIFVLATSISSILLLRRVPWLPPDIYDLVYNSKFSYLGSSDLNKSPHVTPMSFAFNGVNLFVMSSVVSKKIKNLNENKKVAFLIDERDPGNVLNNKAVLFTGTVRIYNPLDILIHPLKLYEARMLFRAKYPEYIRKYAKEKRKLPKAWQLIPMISRILVEIEPEKIVYWRKAEPISLPA